MASSAARQSYCSQLLLGRAHRSGRLQRPDRVGNEVAHLVRVSVSVRPRVRVRVRVRVRGSVRGRVGVGLVRD